MQKVAWMAKKGIVPSPLILPGAEVGTLDPEMLKKDRKNGGIFWIVFFIGLARSTIVDNFNE